MKKLKKFLGIETDGVSRTEKLVATLGGFTGIFLVAFISFQFTGASGAALMVPSMGASAVLLFAVPHGKLSQPWALFGGHMVSALVGVTCYRFVPDPFFASALAVALAIGAMHVLDCIHPPGGATALAAVIGGPGIHTLGYGYALSPVLLNNLVIFATALVFSGFFPWRRYPASLMRFTDVPAAGDKGVSRMIDRNYIEQALADMDMIVDLTTDDLQQLFALTLEHAENQHLAPADIKLGHYYTNARHGGEWSVRQILDESRSQDPVNDLVIYRVVEGRGLRSADSCTRDEFARWAVRQVFPTGPRPFDKER